MVRKAATKARGPDYEIVEIGFDTPFQGPRTNPGRNFPSPEISWREKRITSLAFNLTGLDLTPDMGPFEVAPGTQWDYGREWNTRCSRLPSFGRQSPSTPFAHFLRWATSRAARR